MSVRPFELVLLRRMTPSYQAQVLLRAGISREEEASLFASSSLHYPSLFARSIDTFAAELPRVSEEVETRIDRTSSQFPDSTAHSFALALWPELVWVVHVNESGLTVGGEFQPKSLKPADAISLPLAAGEWCRLNFERVAQEMWFEDGWDEQQIMGIRVDGRRFRAEFIFGLLQDWSEVAPE